MDPDVSADNKNIPLLVECALRIDTCEVSVYTVRTFSEMHARLRDSKSLLTFYQIISKPDFPSLADAIAEPCPNMNIKVAAFTLSEKYISNRREHSFKAVESYTKAVQLPSDLV